MERRRFLTASLAASAMAFTGKSGGQETAGKPREYYELRKYHMQSGPETKLTESYVSGALIPALNRMGMSPIGAFNLSIGPETPTLYVLIPSTSVEALVTADLHLAQDKAFMQAAEPFWNAPATAPPYVRIESSLMIAFEGWPKLTPPASRGKRLFQLRTYESPTNQDHVRKVEMFHNGEFEIFQKAGFGQVFYGDSLIGPRLPNLTYMLTFGDIGEMNAKWAAFGSDPDWKKLSASPRYAFEQIVSNITNLILTPTDFSQ
ncbi:MAG TPA: NIPSNAP family protein, partial [Alloacidobacterium sp.]|nr:NIPSNAP family protein [Alloacidobacterium sp.]